MRSSLLLESHGITHSNLPEPGEGERFVKLLSRRQLKWILIALSVLLVVIVVLLCGLIHWFLLVPLGFFMLLFEVCAAWYYLSSARQLTVSSSRLIITYRQGEHYFFSVAQLSRIEFARSGTGLFHMLFGVTVYPVRLPTWLPYFQEHPLCLLRPVLIENLTEAEMSNITRVLQSGETDTVTFVEVPTVQLEQKLMKLSVLRERLRDPGFFAGVLPLAQGRAIIRNEPVIV